MTISYQSVQLSFVIVHFSSLCLTYLSKIPCSPISFLPTKRLPIFLKACTTLTAGILRLVFTCRDTRRSFLWGNAKPLSFEHGAPAEPTGWALPAASRERVLPDKGWREQRTEETPVHRLRSANNFQPLENLRELRGRLLFFECALLCFWPAGNDSAADEDDASGRGDFSNWGGEEEAASGERRRKRSLYKAAKFRNSQCFLRKEKSNSERAEFGEFWNCHMQHKSELRPSRILQQHSFQGSNSKPRYIHPTTFLKCTRRFSHTRSHTTTRGRSPGASRGLKFNKSVCRIIAPKPKLYQAEALGS